MSTETPPAIDTRRSMLGRARGLGSSKTGVHHWVSQRLSAVALIPLTFYYVFSALALAGDTRAEVAAYMALPWNAVLFLALIAMLFKHLALGMQVIFEDYSPTESAKITNILVIQAVCALLALACAVSVLKLAFTA